VPVAGVALWMSGTITARTKRFLQEAIELSNGQQNALCQLLLLSLLRRLQRLQRLLRRRRRQLVLLRLLLRHAAGGCGALRLARGPRHITACHPMQSTR